MVRKSGIEPVSALKTRSADLIEKARETRRPIVITQHGKATAVLQDIESFEKQRESLLLLKLLAAGDQQLRKGKTLSHEEALAEIDAHLARLDRD